VAHRKLLISDANIIIDVIAGGLVDDLFQLDYTFGTPDILFEKELKDQHPEIISAGLQVLELNAETVAYASSVFNADVTDRVSLMDCVALALARQENCTLLTGDARLRKHAETESIEVKGTLWIVQQLLDNKLIDTDKAEDAYQKMRNDGSRLPEKEITKQLKAYRNK